MFQAALYGAADDSPESKRHDDEFLFHYRMTKQNFWELHDLIKDHDIFKRTGPGRQQGPPAYQLLVLLKYLGSQGIAASNLSMASYFRIGRGTAETFRRRALIAVLSLESRAYLWPDENERKEMSRRIKAYYHFPNCVGMIDGTLLPLEFKPSLYGENYYSRKKVYAIQMLVVCDDNARITYYHCGWPGSVHDNRVWRTCGMGMDPNKFFSKNEYLLGDSAFQVGPHLVPAFKTAKGVNMNPNEAAFNLLLSSPRVKSEHCIGILKARFPWLKNIRILITCQADAKKIVNFVRAAVVLHNLLIGTTCPAEWMDDDSEDDLTEDDELNQEILPPDVDPNASSRRNQLIAYFAEEGVGGII
jgi:hypothetical protein